MPIRNPFKKAQTAQEIYEQNRRDRNSADKGFEEANVQGSKPVEIKEPAEYKLSDINDSGVYLPPSPPAKEKTFFSRSSTTSTQNSTHRSVLSENEPFNISRESFDSYRRSFDISARSPISTFDNPSRQSLDSRRKLNAYSPRPSFQEHARRSEQMSREPLEERFEDVGLNDEAKPQQKKRGFLSRFGDSTNESTTTEAKPPSAHHNFLSSFSSGRKRGQSGTGAELGNMPRPESRNAVEVGAN